MAESEYNQIPSPPKPEKRGFFSRLFSKKKEVLREDFVKEYTFPEINKEELSILSGEEVKEEPVTPETLELPSDITELPEIREEEFREELESKVINYEKDNQETTSETTSFTMKEHSEPREEVEGSEEETPGWAVSSEEPSEEQPSPQTTALVETEEKITEKKSEEERELRAVKDVEKMFDNIAKKHAEFDKELGKIMTEKEEIPLKLKMKVSQEKYFWLKNGQPIRSFKELLEAMDFIDDETFRHHVTENRNDFANWVAEVLEEEKLAEKIRTKTAKEELIKILKQHERAMILKSNKQSKILEEKEVKIKQLKEKIDRLEREIRQKSAALLEERKAAAKKIKEKIQADAQVIVNTMFGDVARREKIIEQKEDAFSSKEEKIRQKEKEIKEMEKDIARRLAVVEKKEADLQKRLESAKEELNELKEIRKEVREGLKKNQLLEKKIKLSKKSIEEVENLKKSLKEEEEKLKEEEKNFKMFVEREKKKLLEEAKRMREEYEKLKAKTEKERQTYLEIKKAQDSIETKKRLIEKEGFERYLRSKLTGTVPGEDDEDIYPDIHKVKHIHIYNMIDECKKALDAGDIQKAKLLYTKSREAFSKAKISSVEKHLLYNSLRELYDDIHLASLG